MLILMRAFPIKTILSRKVLRSINFEIIYMVILKKIPQVRKRLLPKKQKILKSKLMFPLNTLRKRIKINKMAVITKKKRKTLARINCSEI